MEAIVTPSAALVRRQMMRRKRAQAMKIRMHDKMPQSASVASLSMLARLPATVSLPAQRWLPADGTQNRRWLFFRSVREGMTALRYSTDIMPM